MSDDFASDLAAIRRIPAVPTILNVICQTTGMGFAAVARVTDSRWIACEVVDNIHFGLAAGGELKVETTICHEIRENRSVVVIDNVAEDPVYANHHTPRMYGLQSYISMPIILADGSFFGTLCAIDSKPAKLNNEATIGMFRLFAELIAHHLDSDRKLTVSEAKLLVEQQTAEVREQFIAVLGHDLRNPLAALDAGANKLLRDGWTAKTPMILNLMKASVSRMNGLVENMMDLARARLGDGITLQRDASRDLEATLSQVVDEMRASHPDRMIETQFRFDRAVDVDHSRIGQMFSNLLGNALTHGATDAPILVRAEATGDSFELAVANAGTAIPADALSRLFQPFYRGEHSSQGLGLGLYIASEIAQAHGGELAVLSDPRETRFTFRMPVTGTPA